MPRAPRRPPPSKSPATDNRGITPRAINSADVDRAADALLRAGSRPTIEKVRAEIGRGSPNTINPLLDQWWSRLAGRLDAGPQALHRLPEPVLHAAEGLWLQALDDARRRATQELGSKKTTVARDRQELEVRSHVLSIRESELNHRLEQAERRANQLQLEVETLTTLLRKEQASRAAAERRLPAHDDAPRRGRAPQPTAAVARAKSRTKSRKPRTKSPRAKAARLRTVSRPPRRTRKVNSR